eukprot:5095623-Prymnesium_polylepis.1
MATSAARREPRLGAMLCAARAAADRPNAHPQPPRRRAAAHCCVLCGGGASPPITLERPTAARARHVATRSLPEAVVCEARTRGPMSTLLRRMSG